MMRNFVFVSTMILLAGFIRPIAEADVVTLSGTITYQGAYSGDTLWVAVIDTAQGEDVTFLAIQPFQVGSFPLNQPYSIDFDNASASAEVVVAALLDVDGGGVDNPSGADIVGWYAGAADPVLVSSALSQSGLDFALPRAEIQGTVTLAPGQDSAWIDITQDPQCVHAGFTRPPLEMKASGSYIMAGIYPGAWCVFAEGNIPPLYARVCYGDPTCVNPVLVTLTAAQVKTGVDFDFTGSAPVEESTWGRLKSRY
jgi:hypothetical protein